jgi:hypothetical protein
MGRSGQSQKEAYRGDVSSNPLHLPIFAEIPQPVAFRLLKAQVVHSRWSGF